MPRTDRAAHPTGLQGAAGVPVANGDVTLGLQRVARQLVVVHVRLHLRLGPFEQGQELHRVVLQPELQRARAAWARWVTRFDKRGINDRVAAVETADEVAVEEMPQDKLAG